MDPKYPKNQDVYCTLFHLAFAINPAVRGMQYLLQVLDKTKRKLGGGVHL